MAMVRIHGKRIALLATVAAITIDFPGNGGRSESKVSRPQNFAVEIRVRFQQGGSRRLLPLRMGDGYRKLEPTLLNLT
jgi:hypothetical protein